MKPACNRTREALAAYVDGENASLQSAEVQQHLESCEDCQILYGEIQHALSMPGADRSAGNFAQHEDKAYFSSAPGAQFWSEFPDRVMERIAARARQTHGDAPVSPMPGRDSAPPARPGAKILPLPAWRRRVTGFLNDPKLRPVAALAAVVVLAVVVVRLWQVSSLSPNRSKAIMTEEGTISAQREVAAPETKASTARQDFSTQPEERTSQAEQSGAETRRMAPFAPAQPAHAGAQANRSEVAAVLQAGATAQGEEAGVAKLRVSAAEDAGAGAQEAVPVAPEPGAAPDNSFALALWNAQHASTHAHQQKIWQEFLATAADSSYVHLGIFHLAQSLAAQADSTSSGHQVRSTLDFFEEHETVLRPLLGSEKFGAEIQRLQSLQKRGKAEQ